MPEPSGTLADDPFRRRRERDLEDEIRTHLRMAEADRRDDAGGPREAARAARKEFGNVALVKEVTRDMWAGGWFDRLGETGTPLNRSGSPCPLSRLSPTP